MKKQWMRFFAVLLLAFGLMAAGCSGNNNKEEGEQTPTVQQEEKEEQHVTVKIQDGDQILAEKEIAIENSSNLLDIMKENFQIEEKDHFVTSIEGVSQNEKDKKYWVFEINGERVNTGAHETEVKNNDEVVWKLEQF